MSELESNGSTVLLDPAKESAIAEQMAASAASTSTPASPAMAPRVESFHGQFFDAVKRTISIPDPSDSKKKIIQRKTLMGVHDAVLQAVIGYGSFSNTGEKFMTFQCQFAPGQTRRLTFSAQNYDTIIAYFHGNVDRSSKLGVGGKIKWPLYKEIKVSAFGTPMKGFGILVQEAYQKLDNGDTKVILGAPEAVENADDDLGAL